MFPMIGDKISAYSILDFGRANMAVNGLTVFIVDDDADVRESLGELLQSEGFSVEAYASGAEFLEALTPEQQGCIILDINLPQISGLDLQHLLAEKGFDLPIIFLTGYGDVPKSTAAFKAGAMDFLEKPVDADILIQGVREALELGSRRQEERSRQQELEALYAHLTPREKEIIVLLARGYSAKQVGRALGISHRTAEIHRARIMEKLGVQSLADLVALAIQIGVR
jgi:FixJ family two-component response regulator